MEASRVTGLFLYPVRESMQGEALAAADIGPAGIVGDDRQWALVDVETGLALTARRQPELLFAAAALEGDGVVVTLPDRLTTSDDAALSAWLGHPVALTRADATDHGTYEIALDFENEVTAEWVQWERPDGRLPTRPAPRSRSSARRRSAPGTSAGSAPTCSSTAHPEDGAGSARPCKPAAPRSRS